MPSESSNAAIGATVPLDSSHHLLRRRIISALVLVPLALALVVLGSPSWDVFVALFGAVMAWEWTRICNQGRLGLAGFVIIAAVLTAIAAAAAALYQAAFLILIAGGLFGTVVSRLGGETAANWQGLGAVYVGAPCISILWVRSELDGGLETLLWVLALVWATDTGAYIAGRRIGGVKLAPRISPNKTWAGLGGGIVAAALVGLAAALWLGTPSIWLLLGVSAALAVVEQVGDLAESAFKRRFGVKDSSDIIPGHGGVLDRVDGLLAVIVAVAGLSLAGGGSVLLW
ncbi:phosphatidate cytidylyltransferase [Rhodospirillaceae bacterium SYSU D60014]|uniref:phosphatidate cytidylyltransferase n=1 Tax=Virgifigura deserti TaxID=2268457 RepID=UPI0013C3E630